MASSPELSEGKTGLLVVIHRSTAEMSDLFQHSDKTSISLVRMGKKLVSSNLMVILSTQSVISSSFSTINFHTIRRKHLNDYLTRNTQHQLDDCAQQGRTTSHQRIILLFIEHWFQETNHIIEPKHANHVSYFRNDKFHMHTLLTVIYTPPNIKPNQ